MLANPFVLAATAIMGVVGAVALLYSGATDAEKEVQKLRDELDGLDQDEGARVAAARIEAQRASHRATTHGRGSLAQDFANGRCD